MHPTIQQARLTQSLLRRLRVRGGLKPELDPVVRPVAIVLDQTRWTDLEAGPVEASGGQTLAAAAGVDPVIQLFHDGGENTVLRVRQLTIRGGVSGTLLVLFGTVVLGAASVESFEDIRFRGRAPVGHVRALTIAGGLAGTTVAELGHGTQQNTWEPLNLIVPPGFGLHVQGPTNSALICNFEWDELENDLS